jgi:hypothetical protein
MMPVAVQSPMMVAYGNHEANLQENVPAWAQRFPTPNGYDGRRNYSFAIGDVQFISLFASHSSNGLTSGQLQWLEQTIISAKQAGKRWIIPYFHVSPFSDGSNHPSNLNLRAQLGPIFERHAIQLAIASHDQSYERTYPLRNVPATNTPTSSSKTCYTLQDGVTWIKVSPGGKLSNINRGFATFTTNPAPAYIAYRNNTMHHFVRLTISASGSLRVDLYGVKGDGTAPIIQDSFRYDANGCVAGQAAEPSNAEGGEILEESELPFDALHSIYLPLTQQQ